MKNIVLIPKVAHLTNLKIFCPNNRLQKVLHISIKEAQSAFISGRLITDNFLLAYELIHTLKQRMMGQHRGLALKLDMTLHQNRLLTAFFVAF
ncbi:reverse transcriptase [Gossypium australe]|uniref:Reverse transcriptase n=1 Tax=Gossypium australe TaxID=47621 RepID=A0A5B6WPA7_9ROSI|nr:reverse transcriptase [Gossypium australe]